MSTSTKTNAREAFVAHVLANGWTVDTTAILTKSDYTRNEYGARTTTYTSYQQPFTYTRPAVHGGRWRITLNYTVDTGWASTRTTTTLRGVTVRHIADDEQPDEHGRIEGRLLGKLKAQSKWQETKWLTATLPGSTLRNKAEALVTNPDLAVWVALAAKHDHDVAQDAVWAQRLQDRKERERPLAITVPQEGYGEGNEWRTLAATLYSASKAVSDADGKTDLPAALDALKAAVAAIDAVVVR